MERIQEQTAQDDQLEKLKKVIQSGNRDNYRKDKDIRQFYSIRQELSIVEGLVLRGRQIVLPASLQQKVVRTAHRMGHLGMTKTKEMLRAKYWFPTMKPLVEQIVGQCFHCQVTTKLHRYEPVKVKVKVQVYSLVSSAKRHSPNFTQLSPSHRTCSFISHLNSPWSIQPGCHFSAHGPVQTQKPSLSYQVPTYSWVERVHV